MYIKCVMHVKVVVLLFAVLVDFAVVVDCSFVNKEGTAVQAMCADICIRYGLVSASC